MQKQGFFNDFSHTSISGFMRGYVQSAYPPFGSPLIGRTYQAESSVKYRFAMNTQEKDDEIYGEGNASSAEFWEYDTRLGRRWNLDPKPQINLSDYSCFSNNPILLIDIDGDKWYDKNSKKIAKNMKRDLKEARRNARTLQERSEMTAAIRELRQMQRDKQNFRINIETLNPNGAFTTLTFNGGTNVIDIVVPWVGIGVASPRGYRMRSLAHELKHGYQFITGKISFDPNNVGIVNINNVPFANFGAGLLYDAEDEVEAFKRGYAFDKAFWGFLRFEGINENTIKAMPAYTNLPKQQFNSSTQMTRIQTLRLREGMMAPILSNTQGKMTYGQYQATLPIPEFFYPKK